MQEWINQALESGTRKRNSRRAILLAALFFHGGDNYRDCHPWSCGGLYRSGRLKYIGEILEALCRIDCDLFWSGLTQIIAAGFYFPATI